MRGDDDEMIFALSNNLILRDTWVDVQDVGGVYVVRYRLGDESLYWQTNAEQAS